MLLFTDTGIGVNKACALCWRVTIIEKELKQVSEQWNANKNLKE